MHPRRYMLKQCTGVAIAPYLPKQRTLTMHRAQQWHRNGTTMAQLWHHHGTTMAPPWHNYGTTMAPPRHHHGTAMAQLWHRNGTAHRMVQLVSACPDA